QKVAEEKIRYAAYNCLAIDTRCQPVGRVADEHSSSVRGKTRERTNRALTTKNEPYIMTRTELLTRQELNPNTRRNLYHTREESSVIRQETEPL
ncbi:hypothetical protein OS493_031189, partial [Desmophyllum pertusum]